MRLCQLCDTLSEALSTHPEPDKQICAGGRSSCSQQWSGVQTEERRRADAKRKAAEAAAEAKQEADIAAYHARLRDKEALRQQHLNQGREDQPAGTLAQLVVCMHLSFFNTWRHVA